MVGRSSVVADGRPRGGAVVFVSYSRADADWRRRFVTMLEPLVRERRLEVWSDERNVVGEEWRPQLAEAIGRSTLALLLVSPDFLASRFIMEKELPALIEQGVRLVCVLVRPALWDEIRVLERLEWAHDPAHPIARARDRDGQIVRVCKALLSRLPAEARAGRRADEVTGPARPIPLPTSEAPAQVAPPPVPAPAPAEAEPLGCAERPGELHGVPPLPREFVAREEFAALRERLLAATDGPLGITGDARALGLHGQGGIGKTVLACALARDPDVRRHFPDGVYWVTVGEQGDPTAVQLDLLARLGAPQPETRAPSQLLEQLRQAFVERRCLLVVDDVWSAAVAAALQAAGPLGGVLYTTRDAAVLEVVGARVERVDVLPPQAARELLAALARTRVAALPPEAARILEATGRVALAVALVGAALRQRSWRDVMARLDQGADTFLDHPYANVFKALQVGVAALEPSLADPYLSLAVQPPDIRVPVAAVRRPRFTGQLVGERGDHVIAV